MTVPSAWLDAIAGRMAVTLGEAGMQRIDVREIDDTVLQDLSEYVTVPAPSILLTCMGFNAIERDAGPTTLEATFVARCIARLSERPDPTEPVRSRGDVAMNLAAFVLRTIDAGELWPDAEGQPVAMSRATRLQARNFGSRALSQKGRSMWVCSWNQQAEISGDDMSSLLVPLKRLSITFAMGDENTPDDSALIELEGGTPP